MNIVKYIVPIKKGAELVEKLIIEQFGIDPDIAKQLIKEEIVPHFDNLIDSIYFFAETSYVDKVFRDSYYYYYSSKLNNYSRYCIRLSIFDGEIDDNDFRNEESIKRLKYRGFIVLRPTEPCIIGRSVISPEVVKHNNFHTCFTTIKSTVNSIKFEVKGFPHSSQDTETISCAETTLWAVMEYFSNKYPDYSPVLPSTIMKTLKTFTAERQLPVRGLDIQQMSFALREFGFGTKIYSKNDYKGDFNKLINIYIESGIPLLLGIDDSHIPGGNIGHAFICIGHNNIDKAKIYSLNTSKLSNKKLNNLTKQKGITIFDYDEIFKEFICVDDNFPAYRNFLLDAPAIGYSDEWKDCEIKHFIAPLYPKIYLEAYQAKNFILSFLLEGPKPLNNGSEILIRFFLASSRSYKEALALNDTFDTDVKKIILEIPLSKFIWIAEISTKELITQEPKLANGIIILDATEANAYNNKPLVFALYQNKLSYPRSKNEKDVILNLKPFKVYTSNLKNFTYDQRN